MTAKRSVSAGNWFQDNCSDKKTLWIRFWQTSVETESQQDDPYQKDKHEEATKTSRMHHQSLAQKGFSVSRWLLKPFPFWSPQHFGKVASNIILLFGKFHKIKVTYLRSSLQDREIFHHFSDRLSDQSVCRWDKEDNGPYEAAKSSHSDPGFGGFCALSFARGERGGGWVVSPFLNLWHMNVLQIKITVLEGGRDDNYMVSTTSKHTPEEK